MSKRIVVGLDGSPYATHALEMAMRRATVYDGVVVGVAVIDRPSIEQLAAGAQPGAFQMSDSAVSSLLNDAKEHAERLIAEFRNTCDMHEVLHEDIIYTGTPFEGLSQEGQTADMIITGVRTFFHYPTREGPGDTLERLLKDPVCPVLAVPKDGDLPRNVVIAYDGSRGAARALQAYAHVTPDIPDIYPVTLLCIAADYDKNKFHLEKAAQFLEAHGIEARIMLRTGKPIDAIMQVMKELHPALIILGSPMHHGITERIFGSTVASIIKDGSIPMFVFH
ncbi:MAG: universal stress protein [Bacteroidetes bacterium]|nr:universal stress protein [Bacteroidota bacterium]